MSNIHTNTVKASGAISVFFTEPKRDWTLSSTNSIAISTKFCMPLGAELESLFFEIAFLKTNIKRAPSAIDQNNEST